MWLFCQFSALDCHIWGYLRRQADEFVKVFPAPLGAFVNRAASSLVTRGTAFTLCGCLPTHWAPEFANNIVKNGSTRAAMHEFEAFCCQRGCLICLPLLEPLRPIWSGWPSCNWPSTTQVKLAAISLAHRVKSMPDPTQSESVKTVTAVIGAS
jgi:hypothetical protein